MPLDDLAARGTRQIVDADVDMDGQFESGEPRAQMFDHLFCGQASSSPCAHDGPNELAEHAIRDADDGGFKDVGCASRASSISTQ